MLVLALKKVQIVKITPLQIPTFNKPLPSNFFLSPLGLLPLPLKIIWKTMNCPFNRKKIFFWKTD